MDVDPERKTSEGTQDTNSADQGVSQQQLKTSSLPNQSQPKARVRSRKKDPSSGGQDDSKRRCVSTACIGIYPSILYTPDLESWGKPLADFCVNSLSEAQIKVRVVQAFSS